MLFRPRDGESDGVLPGDVSLLLDDEALFLPIDDGRDVEVDGE